MAGRVAQRQFVVTRFNDLDRLTGAAIEGLGDTLRAAGFEIEARTKTNIRDVGAIDTGNLLNSV